MNSKNIMSAAEEAEVLRKRRSAAQEFRAAFRGIPTYQLASALTRLTPGVTWVGSSKALMAEAWGSRKDTNPWCGATLRDVTLQMIKDKLEARRR